MSARKIIANSTIASSLLLCTAVGAAPPANWGGFYIDAAIGARSSTTEATDTANYSYSAPGINVSAWNSNNMDFGKTNFIGQISGGWRWANPSVVVGLGLFVDLAGDNAGGANISSSVTGTGFAGSSFFSSYDLTQKNRYGISLDIGPNWRTHPYAKLTYAWSDYEITRTDSACDTTNPAIGPWGYSLSNTYSGVGIGGGVRHLQTDNLYFFAEVMWQDYGSKTNSVVPLCSRGYALAPGESYRQEIKLSPTDLTGVVGVGWKF